MRRSFCGTQNNPEKQAEGIKNSGRPVMENKRKGIEKISSGK
jgi:hypothetical protein